MPPSASGRMISHYRLLEKLGEGGVGEVYRAEDTVLRRIVALKFLHSKGDAERSLNERFLREAQAGAALEHQNICPTYGIEDHGGQTFIVMGYVDGEPLSARIKKGLKLGEALDIAIGVGEGLDYAHQNGVIHRDVKAANILLTKTGVPRISDFGIARIEKRSRLTTPGAVIGTVNCMAPEQLMAGEVDRRTDIWALGVLLYHMLTGRRPFSRGNVGKTINAILREAAPDASAADARLPPELCGIAVKAMSKAREDRYQHAGEMVVDLRRVKTALSPEQSSMTLHSVEAVEPSSRTVTLAPGWLPAAKLKWPVLALLAVLLAVLMMVLFSMRR
ncbi:MAG: serine/threonine protein kinase [Bryobacteraceae bacterium]|nr:serine/threonine protein kinase [Bryobacteraceae bacterium]